MVIATTKFISTIQMTLLKKNQFLKITLSFPHIINIYFHNSMISTSALVKLSLKKQVKDTFDSFPYLMPQIHIQSNFSFKTVTQLNN